MFKVYTALMLKAFWGIALLLGAAYTAYVLYGGMILMKGGELCCRF